MKLASEGQVLLFITTLSPTKKQKQREKGERRRKRRLGTQWQKKKAGQKRYRNCKMLEGRGMRVNQKYIASVIGNPGIWQRRQQAPNKIFDLLHLFF